MFESLSERLSASLKAMAGKSRLTEDNIRETLREVRMALLEADVALSVVRDFTDRVKERAVGTQVSSSLSPARSFLKLFRPNFKRSWEKPTSNSIWRPTASRCYGRGFAGCG